MLKLSLALILIGFVLAVLAGREGIREAWRAGGALGDVDEG